MKKTVVQKAILSLAGLLTAALLLFSHNLRLPVLDDAADAYFRTAITKGGLSYAACRMINASVSIIKESSLHLEPAGVGISLAAGQALDPIDDLAERVSDVLVTAVTSLGVQKLTYEIGVSLAPPVLAVFLLLMSILVWFCHNRVQFIQKNVTRFALFLFAARFCLPLSSMANEAVNQSFFNERIEQVRKDLTAGSVDLNKMKDFSVPEGGILGAASMLRQKTEEFKDAVAAVGENMGEIIEHLLQLAFLYLGIFLIQVIVLPLLAFFFLMKTANAIFGTNLPLTISV
jgi:signal transduction histidine kinase